MKKEKFVLRKVLEILTDSQIKQVTGGYSSSGCVVVTCKDGDVLYISTCEDDEVACTYDGVTSCVPC